MSESVYTYIRIFAQPCFSLFETTGTLLVVLSRQVRDLTAATIKKTISEVPGARSLRHDSGRNRVGQRVRNGARDRGLREDDDDDVAEAAMFTEEPPENEDEAEEEEGEAAFFVHVRSWSHVFQLLMGDVAKQLTTAVEVLRKVLHISRSTRDHVARLRIIAGKSTTKLIIPTVGIRRLRWNSQTRSAARILDFVCELRLRYETSSSIGPGLPKQRLRKSAIGTSTLADS
jgi:hypothetical protein